ncbi:MAG: GNAT family N-acetyltransferase [Oscillospiraceae bacterium]|nr:GNAT family N-acetyltransferase [Oscillospiraceae bacterium]
MIKLETNRLILQDGVIKLPWEDGFLDLYKTLLDEFYDENYSEEMFKREVLFNYGLSVSELGNYFAVFNIIYKEDNSFIGWCKFLPRYFSSNETWIINTQGDRAKWPGTVNVEINWNILKKYQNMGFAKEAAHAIIEYAFNKLQFSKVIAITDINNAPSMKIMESLDMHVKIAPNSSLAYGVAYNSKY